MSASPIRNWRGALLLAASATGFAPFGAVAADTAPSQVPFVGCPSHGLAGPVAAPADAPQSIAAPAASARRLALYRGRSLGVLAPRDWQCKAVYGAIGTTLLITPQALDWTELHTDGPAIQAVFVVGDTGGRIESASIAARFFPELMRDYILRVSAHAMVPVDRLMAVTPYPEDRVKRLSPTLVQFETPANREGFGTDSLLNRSGQPVSGLVAINPSNGDIYELFVRLPASERRLEQTLLAFEAQHLTQQSAIGTPR